LQLGEGYRLDAEAEKSRYLQHRNDTDDPGYLAFLDRLARPVLLELDSRRTHSILHTPANQCGLDFGSGPFPMLAMLMERSGYPVEIYDPFFAPIDRAELSSRRYDFILCCETAEHFHDPDQEFELMVRTLAPGGFIALMTAMRPADDKLADWHYLQDLTHVSLYSPASFRWIAGLYDLTMVSPARDVIFLYKPA
jgi:SAM-dependent methyltransferase